MKENPDAKPKAKYFSCADFHGRAGDSYTAKLDGTDAPVKGAYGWDTVSLKLINDRTIEETDQFNGKVVAVSKMTVQPTEGR